MKSVNLWESRCHRLSEPGHDSFWEAQEEFAPVLERFLQDVKTDRATSSYKD